MPAKLKSVGNQTMYISRAIKYYRRIYILIPVCDTLIHSKGLHPLSDNLWIFNASMSDKT